MIKLTTAKGRNRRKKMRKTVKETGKRNEKPRSALLFTGGDKMKTYGYARCSTNEDRQDINRQIRELKAAGVELQYILEKMKKTKEI